MKRFIVKPSTFGYGGVFIVESISKTESLRRIERWSMWVKFQKTKTREIREVGQEIKLSEIIIGKWKNLEF